VRSSPVYFLRLEHYVRFDVAQWRPRSRDVAADPEHRLPAGGEFALMAIYVGVVYWIIRDFGVAGAGRIRHRSSRDAAIFLPAMAIAFAAAPIAGPELRREALRRVRETFRVGGVRELRGDGCADDLLPVEADGLIRAFTQRRRRCSKWARSTRDHVVELRARGARVLGVEPLPGNGQHVAVAREQRVAPRAVRRAGDPAVDAPDSNSRTSGTCPSRRSPRRPS
jgi:hypothetical protein